MKRAKTVMRIGKRIWVDLIRIEIGRTTSQNGRKLGRCSGSDAR
jgi:hypothetical protein